MKSKLNVSSRKAWNEIGTPINFMLNAGIMSFKIRAAIPDEAGILSRLAIRSKAYWGYSQNFLDACRQELAVSPEDIEAENYRYGVAENDGRVIGFYALKRLSAKRFELEALFVEPDHIGTGVGRVLMAHAYKSVRSQGGTRITIQSDPYAAHFYEAAGGVLTGERESGSIPGRFLPVYEITLTN